MYDLVVIGGGIGGYTAAVRAQELGAKVCIVEKDLLGGVCLNKGCIPTKTIMKSLDLIQEVKRASEFGIDISDYKIDITKIQKRKDEVVLKLRRGLEALLKSKKIDIIKGKAFICDTDKIEVGGKSISSEYIIIATGSCPMEQEDLKIDHRHILSSDDILEQDRVAKSMVIIGGGVIGCELASIYNRLGCKVTIVELMEQLLPYEDKEMARRLEASFNKSGIDIIKGSKVVSFDTNNGVKVNLEDARSVEAEIALLCIGRRPNISGLNLDKVGIKTDNGKVWVNQSLKTNIPNIYAVGDVIDGHFLAHVASYEGATASENIFGRPRSADYSAVPNCIFTSPQISSIGITENRAKELGLEFLITRLPFAAIGKAHILGETEGFIKLICDAKTEQILGVHIFGVCASELISEFAIAMRRKMTTRELAEVIYPHPTLSEGIPEAACRSRSR